VPGPPVPLRLLDAATRQVRPVAAGATAGMYVCGITPYDSTHLGHAATYLTFDLVHRVLRDNGHEVTYVQNLTDVDDPLLMRARQVGEDWRELAARETRNFRRDMAALSVLPPTTYQGVVEAIPLVVDLIQRLRAAGACYELEGDIYFPVVAARRFGSVSGADPEKMLALFAAGGGDPGRPGKRHPLDALVWRGPRTGEPYWDSAIGPGRPGWHAECAAIAVGALGTGFDIQGGGRDLTFPHHELTAAHAEVAMDTWPFARLYVHAGMMGLDGEKMSKSRGNLVFVASLLERGADPAALRLALIAQHYTLDRMWSDSLLEEASVRLCRWRSAVDLPSGPSAADCVTELRRALADNLDTPRALAAVDRWVVDSRHGGGADPHAPREVADAVCALLGVVL